MRNAPALHVAMEHQEPCFTMLQHRRLQLPMVRPHPVVSTVAFWMVTSLALTQHNIVFQAQVVGQARDAILAGTFPHYLQTFFANYFGDDGYPEWCVNALQSVGVDLLEGKRVKVVPGDGAKWEYSDAS
jgi:hypothetical protein